MALISLTNAYLSFSDHPLLDHAELHIEPNERVCLVGRNGAGKSTLLKIIAQQVTMDDGKVQYEKDLVVSRLEQDPPRHAEGNVFDYVACVITAHHLSCVVVCHNVDDIQRFLFHRLLLV